MPKQIKSTKINVVEIDADGEVLGRLAVRAAIILRQKDTPGFLPYLMPTQKVIVYNTDKIRVTGRKYEDKIYYHHSGYPGGLKETPLKDELERDSREVVRRAIYGMLPKNKLRDKIIRNLTLFKEQIDK